METLFEEECASSRLINALEILLFSVASEPEKYVRLEEVLLRLNIGRTYEQEDGYYIVPNNAN